MDENIKKYCPDVKHVVVIFNPADVTALTALIHSGLKANQLTSLAALELAGEQGERILIEESIEGTEITVPVIGNEDPTALPYRAN